MKKLIFSLSIALVALYGCHTKKDAVNPPVDAVEGKPERTEEVDHGSAPSTLERVKGIVHMEENCGAVIEVTYGDVIYRFFPLNLEDKYKKDGLAIKFAFKEDESSVPEAFTCEVINKIVAVSDVTPVR